MNDLPSILKEKETMSCFFFQLLVNSLRVHLLNYTTIQTNKTKHGELRLKKKITTDPTLC